MKRCRSKRTSEAELREWGKTLDEGKILRAMAALFQETSEALSATHPDLAQIYSLMAESQRS